MSVFSHREFNGHEQVSFFNDRKTGLRSIIAVHNTHLGPALGGCRMFAYEGDEQALKDVLRLSRGMTYKNAMADIPCGGGKSVIIGDPRKVKTPDLMRAMGRAIDSLRGRYISAEDMGTTVADINLMHRETQYVVGTAHDGPNGSTTGFGDPSPTTAHGVYVGLRTAVRHRLGLHSLRGVKVAVQGLGNVGYNLCRLLAKDGAQLYVTDVQADRIDSAVREFGATPVSLDGIYAVEAQVFAPCAMGGILNDETIPRLQARVVAGAANNQLAEARHGDLMQHMKILYAPDYVINAGGVINCYYDYISRAGKVADRATVLAHVDKIGPTTEAIFRKAEQEGIPTAFAADRLAEQRFMSGPPGPHMNKAACA